MPSAACRQPPAAFGEASVSLGLGLSTATPNLSTVFPVIQQRPLSIFLVWRLDRWGAVTGGPDEWDAVILMAQSISTTP